MKRESERRAFPGMIGEQATKSLRPSGQGMSLRDFFAGMAIASGRVPMPWENSRPDGGPSPERQTREKAYCLANAMLGDDDND